MLNLHVRIGRGWIEVSKVGVVDGFNRQCGIIVQSAIKGERAIFQRDSRGESDRQDAAVFADQILPLQAHLIVGDFLDAGSTLLCSENEVRALFGQWSMQPEGDT